MPRNLTSAAPGAHRARGRRVFHARVTPHFREGPMDPSHRRTYVTVALVVALVLVAALAAACSAQATGGAAGIGHARRERHAVRRLRRAQATRPRASAKGADGDWTRVLERPRLHAEGHRRPSRSSSCSAAPPPGSRPSATRAGATRSSPNGGPATLAWNMGSRNRTMAQNVAIVKKLPAGRPRHRLHRHQPGLVHLRPEDGLHHPAVPAADRRRPRSKQPHQYGTRRPASSRRPRRRRSSRAGSPTGTPCSRATSAPAPAVLETLIKVCKTARLQAGALRAAAETPPSSAAR